MARKSVIIQNNTFKSFNRNGVVILYSNSITVENNIFLDFEGIAIETDYSHYCTIRSNKVYAKNNTLWGMGIWSSGEGTKIIDNTLDNINYGIYAFGNYKVVISENTIINTIRGMYLSHLGYSNISDNVFVDVKEIGLYLHHSGLNDVFNNTITNCSIGLGCSGSYLIDLYNNTIANNELGSYIYNESPGSINYIHAYNNTLYLNTFRNNIEYGLAIGNYSFDTIIYLNSFENNNLGGSQAFDEGTRTIWYDVITLIGNYWDDWSGTGSYTIEGSSNSEDLYPLSEPPF